MDTLRVLGPPPTRDMAGLWPLESPSAARIPRLEETLFSSGTRDQTLFWDLGSNKLFEGVHLKDEHA
jgi:hypothetical protein